MKSIARPAIAIPSTLPTGDVNDDHFRISDVAKLARRLRRRIVGAARADDRITFNKLLHAHLGAGLAALDVVEESWPSYDHVNVQVGLDAWLTEDGRKEARARRTAELPAP